MKYITSFTLGALMISQTGISVVNANPVFTERVPVLDVRPLYRYVRVNNPSRDCYYEDVEHTEKKPSSGKIIAGALIGGALGRKLGRKSSKGRRNTSTAAGALAGALIGKSLGSNRTQRHTETRQVCRRRNNFHEERRLTGFRTYYEFRGRRYHSDLRREPGQTILIRFVGRAIDR